MDDAGFRAKSTLAPNQIDTLITPVLLAGGSGTRLWPVSRQSHPKQFAQLVAGGSLFQQSARRLSGPGFAAPLVLTHTDFRFVATEQLADIGITPDAVLIEPMMRNTAPAILAAALYLAETNPDTLMLVAPSDHIITDAAEFAATVANGVEAALGGALVTFGITPDRPETGYGWLMLDGPAVPGQPSALHRFVEKPDAATAQEMLEAGNFLWNAGIFLFTARHIIAAFETHQPAMLTAVRDAVTMAQIDLGFLRLAPESWAEVEDISIDYAIMERAGPLVAVPFGGHWSDLGGWEAVWRTLLPAGGDDGVVTDGAATAIACRNVLLKSETPDIELVGIGLQDIIAVATPDAVLVANAGHAQEVRRAVTVLKERGARQATRSRREHRPWGWFETLAMGDRFQVKRITVQPGGTLSLQSHYHRAEHWIIVSGTARVTIADTVTLMTENQSIYIPLGAAHRLENPGKVPMVLIEVQTGSYLGEDDITRYEDVYSRDGT